MKAAIRLLVAEDDPYDARIVLQVLQLPADETLVVRNGHDAVDYLQRRSRFVDYAPEQPALMLLDLRMPQVDGFEVLKQVKGNAALRFVPMVVLTVSPDHRDMEHAYGLGANGYVVKDMDFESYLAALHELKRFWLEVNDPPPACLGRSQSEAAGKSPHAAARDRHTLSH